LGNLGRRNVVGGFDGGKITSDGGGLLLREVESRLGILERLAGCFTDHRRQDRIEHPVAQLVGQRVAAIALGYEDVADHDELRHDPLLAVVCGKTDVAGADRKRRRDEGVALAGKSTVNRLELRPETAGPKERYKKIEAVGEMIDDLMVDIFLESFAEAPREIVLDLDATDDLIHGGQEGRFYHGYYKGYCYLPLYVFCGEHLLCARLRTADRDASAGTEEEMERIVGRIRARWPKVRIVLRADSGFCRESIMDWCESHDTDYVFGIARNSRLTGMIAGEMEAAKQRYEETGEAAREFADLEYRTLDSWSRGRRVVGKAEYLAKGANPRFVVTSLAAGRIGARELYEKMYCARGEMENRIKEQQLWLFADRTSCQMMRANQLRLYFSSFAYILMHALRRLGLKGTEHERAQCGTIRVKLFKIGALVRISVRRIRVFFSESYPYKALFRQIAGNLRRIPIRA
jgi:hypothetical protein